MRWRSWPERANGTVQSRMVPPLPITPPTKSNASIPSTSRWPWPSGWTRRSTSSTLPDTWTSPATRSPASMRPIPPSWCCPPHPVSKSGPRRSEYAERRALPRMFFVSLMDKEHANFERVYNQIKEQLTPKVIPVEIPVGEGLEFHGIINLFSKKAHLYKKGTKAGEYDEVDVPDEYKDRFDKYSQELIESIAATDDTLLERYLGGA